MISRTSERFRKAFLNLPQEIQLQAKDSFKQFKNDPYYPSLRFKRVHSTQQIYSVRITRDYRAVCFQSDNELIWFWIGAHDDYSKLLSHL